MKCIAILLASTVGGFFIVADQASEPRREIQHKIQHKQALSRLNSLIGDWRGVGQLKRGSRKGAWSEKAAIAWSFQKDQPAITLTADGGQQFQKLQFTWLEPQQMLSMNLIAKDQTMVLTGKIPEVWPGKIELLSLPQKNGAQFRCTIQQLSDKRATVLLEKRATATGSFRRTAAIGYTRAGERLAVVGGNKRKCIVTGGLGTIPVTHKGKTYYVCCQGCVQAFNDAPDAIIAEYKATLDKKD